MATYQPYWAARVDLLARAGDGAAREAFARASVLAIDPALREHLARRARAL